MFTGIVEELGSVASFDGTRLRINAATVLDDVHLGDSIAVNGCCLTLAAPPAPRNLLAFDAVPQTLRITTLGTLTPGSRVNLEHAATPATLLGGHLVQGHVDTTGTVHHVNGAPGGDYRISIRVPSSVAPFMIPKGSVCIDGVSLTIADATRGGEEITVALIPATLSLTTLGELRAGQAVNIEADATVKAVVTAVERIMESRR